MMGTAVDWSAKPQAFIAAARLSKLDLGPFERRRTCQNLRRFPLFYPNFRFPEIFRNLPRTGLPNKMS
jgi:hypothetical protein